MIYMILAEESFSKSFVVKADSEEEAREIAERYLDSADGGIDFCNDYDGRTATIVDSCEEYDDSLSYYPLVTKEDV